MIRKQIAEIVKEAIQRSKDNGLLPHDTDVSPVVEIPREKGHGDYSTNVAFLLARKAKKNPDEIARFLISRMSFSDLCKDVSVAARGFINFQVLGTVFRSEREPDRPIAYRPWTGRSRRRRSCEDPGKDGPRSSP
jgi:arginyl-tRNA synthetase